jgi:serine/threonine protein kinase
MDWVDGIELHTWLDKNLYAQAQIASIAQAWKQIQTDLLRAHFVHGDIQHGNLLWERETGQLRLIDYDGSMVPPLFALPRRERGHPSYQHPLCFTTPQLPGGIHLDRFPLLVIYVTLRVLQVVPEVWYRLDNGENMLFRREDFTTPHSSRAFNILRSALMGYPQERRLVEILQSSCNLPLARVPLLQTLP